MEEWGRLVEGLWRPDDQAIDVRVALSSSGATSGLFDQNLAIL